MISVAGQKGEPMSDLIDRQAAIDALCKAGCGSGYCGISCDDVKAIEQLPPAQPDIVACGDCIHWICHDRRCGYWNHGVKPLEWCCHGERKE